MKSRTQMDEVEADCCRRFGLRSNVKIGLSNGFEMNVICLFKGKLLRLLVKGERNFKDFGGSPYLDRQKDEKLSDRDRKNKSFLSISQYLS